MTFRRIFWMSIKQASARVEHVVHMKLEEGKIELLLRWGRFFQLSGEVSRLLSRFLLSLSVSKRHVNTQHLPRCLAQLHALWGHLCKRPWTAARGAWLSWLLLTIVRIKLPWECVHHPCNEHVRAISGSADWGGSACWGHQHVIVCHC